MKCRGGLWSPRRSQKASGKKKKNHMLCLWVFDLQCIPLSYLRLLQSIPLFLTLFHHRRHYQGSCCHDRFSPFFVSFQAPLSFFPLLHSDFLSAFLLLTFVYLAPQRCMCLSLMSHFSLTV